MGAGLWPRGAALGARGRLCAGLCYWRWHGRVAGGLVVIVNRDEALDKMAENARELGLDYEPDWKAEYQKAVELHCITLDELREARAEIKAQDAMLERQTARIVDLQTHIENFDGEDR